MAPAAKNGLLAIVVAVAIGGAIYFFARSAGSGTVGGAANIPAGGPKTQWICDKCSKHYELDSATFAEWAGNPEKRSQDPKLGTHIVFWCQDCKAFNVVRAIVRGADWSYAKDSQGNLIKPPKKK